MAGGMELALWCDARVMAKSVYFGVYCRRWGVPLIDGAAVRLPRPVGRGKALEIIMIGVQSDGRGGYRIGLCEKVVAHGQARVAAEAMAQEIARFPQARRRADQLSVSRACGASRGARAWRASGRPRRHRQSRGHRRRKALRQRHGDFKGI